MKAPKQPIEQPIEEPRIEKREKGEGHKLDPQAQKLWDELEIPRTADMGGNPEDWDEENMSEGLNALLKKEIHHRTPEEQAIIDKMYMDNFGYIPVDEKYDPNEYNPIPVDIDRLFPTITVRGFLRTIDYESILKDVRRLVSTVREIEGDDLAKNYTTYFHKDIREEMEQLPWFAQFSDQIKDTYIDYCTNVYGHELDYLSRDDIHLFAWANVYTEDHAHEVHNHVDSNISGTWYIKVDENTAPIKFLSPNLMAQFSHTAVDKFHHRPGFRDMGFVGTDFVESEVHFQPLEKEFILWPSYLQHMVPMNTTPQDKDYERISISFNLKHRTIINNNTTGNNLEYKGKLKDVPRTEFPQPDRED